MGFGNGGVITDHDPVEQEKTAKFNALLTNAVTFNNALDIAEILRQLQEEGRVIDPEGLAARPRPRRDRRHGLPSPGALTGAAPHLVLEMLAGPLQGMYEPSGHGGLLFAFLPRRRRPSGRTSASPRPKGSTPRPARASTAAGPRSSPTTCSTPCSAAARAASPSSRSS
ncbi:Tn3 family transposase [Streptomyces sp. NBC_01794]|uniref:Tn3 family transposase n=1 Tax=Streptomyces sp. NBC_01794 TaxID=2975942 RepID=UPI003873CA57